jgi:hypothetical protein
MGIGIIYLQDSQGLLHDGMVHMPLQNICGHIDGCAPAGTGNAAAITDIKPVGNNQIRVGLRELFDKIPVVEPTDADAVILHDAGLHQRKNPGAHANQINVLVCSPLYEQFLCGAERQAGVQQTAHHDQIIKARRIAQFFRGHHLDCAGRAYRRQRFIHHMPGAANWLTVIAFVAGQTQDIQQTRECGQRKVRQQQKAEANGRGIRRFSGHHVGVP